MTPDFVKAIFTVNIAKFHTLSHQQADYIYGGLFRSAFKKFTALRREGHFKGNANVKNVFTVVPFSPPWFVGKMNCTVDGQPVYSTPISMKKTSIPDKKQKISTAPRTIVKI